MINILSRLFVGLLLFTSLFGPASAFAQAFGPQLTYHGRILDTNGGSNVPVTGNVTFLLQIVHPDVPTCVLYQETQSQNLTATDGNFTLAVNGSAAVTPVATTFADVWITDPARSINCINGGSVNGSANSRRLNVYFIPPGGSAAYEPLPSQTINYVPLAIEALNTNAVGGFGATSLLRVVDASVLPAVPWAVPAITKELYGELDATIKGNSSYYITSAGTVANFSGSLQGDVTGVQSATVVSRIFGRPLSTVSSTFVGGEVLYYNGTNWITKQGSAGTMQSVTSANNYLSIAAAPPSNNPNVDALLTINVGTVANTVAAGNDARIVGALQASTPLAGDVTGLVSTTVVATVGGKTAAAIATSVNDTSSATANATASAIMRRDGSGNVAVNTISSQNNSTHNLLLYNSGNTQYATISVPSALGVSYALTLPNSQPVSGFVLGTQGNGQMLWVNPIAGAVTNVSATAPLSSTGGATPVISIPPSNYTIDGYLSAVQFTNFSNKVASVTVTAPLTIAGTSQTPLLGLQNSGVVSGTYTKVTVDAKGIITSGTTLVAADIPNLDASKITTGTLPVARGGTGTGSLAGNGFLSVNSGGSSFTSTVCAVNEVPFFNGASWTCKLASSLNSSATLVMRDSNGDFTANNITTVQNMTVQANLRVQNGIAGSYIGLAAPIITPNYDITLPSNTSPPVAGQVLSVLTATGSAVTTTWVNALSDALSSGSIFVGNASGTAIGRALSGDATLSNTGVMTLTGVGGNITSGSQYTKVTVDGKGRVVSGAQFDNADVVAGLGYVPMNSVSSTAPITISGGASNPTVGLANSGVVSGAYGSNSLIPNFVVDVFGRITSATLTTYADATNISKGIVQVGSNITVTTGVISVTSANIVAAMGQLGGDVSGTLNNTVVMTVGGKTSTEIADSVSLTQNATANNSSGTIVRRDAAGNFTANNITTVQDMTVQRNLRVQNGLSNYIGITAPIASPNYDIILPNNSVAPTVGQVLTVASGSTGTLIATRWMNALTDVLASGTIFVGNASNVASGVAMSGDAAISNTGNLQLSSVGAGVTSGSQYTKVTVDGKGRVTSATQLNNTDVTAGLGYVPMNSVSTTAPITLTGGSSNPTIGLANSGVAAATYGSNTLVPFFTVDAFGRITSAGSQVYADATSGTKGIVQVGSNITVTTGVISVTSANIIAAMGSLGGDVSGTLNNTVVMTVGGKTSTEIADSVSLTQNATANNSSGTIVRRDAAGNFTANNITTVQDMTVQRNLRVQNGLSNYIGITAPIASPNYDIILPNNSVAPTVGQVLTVASGSTGTLIATRWMNALTDVLASGTIFVGNASNVASGVAMSGDAAISNTGNLQLSSVGAGVTSGSQYTKVTVDGKGRVTSATQLNNTDVTNALGYTPTNLVSVSSPLAITGGSSNPVISLNLSGVTSGVYPKVTVDQWGRVTSGANLTNADITFGLGFSPMNSVSSTSPITLTGGASNPIIGLAPSGVVSGLYPKVTVDQWGRVTSGTNLSFADVTFGLGYTPVHFVSATAPIMLSGSASSPVITLANSGVSSGTYGSSTGFPTFSVDTYGRITSAGISVYADATSSTKGIVSVGSNITVTAGVISVTSGNIVSALGQIGGDVSGTLNATVVQTVGGKTSAQISQSVSDTLAATANNSSGTIVKRDAAGNFTANNITTVQDMTVQRNLRVQDGSVGGYIGLTTPVGVANYDIVLPANGAPSVGQILGIASGTTSATIRTGWVNSLSDALGSAHMFIGSALGIATPRLMSGDATMNASGVLSLADTGVVSGSQFAKVIVDGKGRVTSGAILLASDVTNALGYTPTNLVSVSSPLAITGGSSNPVISLNLSGVTSGVYPKVTVDQWGRVTSGANLTNADITFGLGFSPMNSVSSTSPITLTGGASNPIIGLAPSGVVSGLYPKVTVDQWGRVTSGTNLNYSDVSVALGFDPVRSVSTTAPIVLTGTASNPVIGLANSGVTAGTYGSSFTHAVVTVDAFGRLTSVTSAASRVADNNMQGVVQIGSNITVTAGTISVTSGNVIAAIGAGLSGDVTGSLSATVVSTVGGRTSTEVADSVSLTQNATANNSSGTIVRRDAAGNFIANNITTVQDMTVQRNLRIQNGSSNYIGITTPMATPSYDIILPPNNTPPAANQVLAVFSATPTLIQTTWANAITDQLASGTILIGGTSGSAVRMIVNGDATLDSSGTLRLAYTGVTSATYGSSSTMAVVQVDNKGRVVSATSVPVQDGSASQKGFLQVGANLSVTGGVVSLTNPNINAALGYTPIASVATTTPLTLTGTASNPVIGLGNSGVTALTYGSSGTIPVITVDAFGRITSVTSQTPRVATVNMPGEVSVGSNIGVSASGAISINYGNVISALGFQPLNKAGDTMSGSLTVSGALVANGAFTANGVFNASGAVTVEPNAFRTSNSQFVLNNNGVGIGTASVATNAILDISSTNRGIFIPRMTTAQVNAVSGSDGLMAYNTSTNTIQVYDGSASMWKSFATTSGAVTSLNGMTNPSQWFTTGSGGTSFNVTSVAGNHTFNIPMAASAGVTQGALSNTQYQTFVDKVTTVSGAAGQITVTGGVSAPVVGLATTTVAAGTYGSSFTHAVVTVDAYGRLTSVASATSRIADTQNPGVVSVGSNIGVSTSGVISINYGNVVGALGFHPVNKAGDTMSGSLTVTNNGLATVDNTQFVLNNAGVGIGTGTNNTNAILDVSHTTKGVMLPRITSVNINAIAGPAAGLLAYDSNINLFRFYNGTGWQSIATASASVTRINGSSQTWQSFTTGSAGTSFNVVTNTGTGDHVFNIPMAASAGVTQGAISNTQYQAFLDKMTSVTGTAGEISVTGPVSTPTIALIATGVGAGTYGSSGTIPVITVDAKGRIVSVASQTPRVATVNMPGEVSVGNNITVSASGAISINAANVIAALGYTPVDDSGDTMTGVLNVIPNGLRTTNNQFTLNSNGVGIGTATNTPNAILDINSTTQGVMFPKLSTATINASSGPAGLFAYNSSTNLFQYYNGTAWQNLATTSGAVTRLNGSSQPWQSFTTGNSGTSFNVVTNTGTGDHVFNIPSAATAGVTQGTLDNTQYQTFVNKVTSVSGAAGQITVTGGVSAPVVGLATTTVAAGTYGSSFTHAVVTVDAYGRLTSVTSATSRIADYQNPGVVSIGTNITVSASGQISVTAANINAAMTSQSAKTFYAGPDIGTGLPSFRTIASTDLPVSGVAGAWVNGGNSMGVSAGIGTIDNQPLAIKTNNITRMSVETTGTVSFAGQAHANLNPLGVQAGTPVNVDANLGNIMTLTTNAGAAAQTINITNVRIGAAYTLVVTRNDANDVGQTNITCAGAALATSYVPANGARSAAGASAKTIYTFIYDGSQCLVTWITGF